MRISQVALSLALTAVVLASGYSITARVSEPADPVPCAETDEGLRPAADTTLAPEANSVPGFKPRRQHVVPMENYSWLADDTEPLLESTNEVVCSEPAEARGGPPIICYDDWGCNAFCCAKRGVIKKIMKCCGKGRQDCQSLCQ